MKERQLFHNPLTTATLYSMGAIEYGPPYTIALEILYFKINVESLPGMVGLAVVIAERVKQSYDTVTNP